MLVGESTAHEVAQELQGLGETRVVDDSLAIEVSDLSNSFCLLADLRERTSEALVVRRPKQRELPFGQVLSSLMAEKGLSNRAAAQLAGISATTIQDWRSGTAPSDLLAATRLADALGVSLRFLLTGEHEKSVSGREMTISEVLTDGGEMFSGICEVKIRRLVPRAAKRGSGDDGGEK